MNTVFFLVMRRMRGPLLLLSFVYAVATLGLTMIPGVDDRGDLWYMDLFHAFYFVSFMGTTTGFGEIPYAFSDAQRMWTLIFIYITVATWIYTIGALIRLLSSDLLRNALTIYQFERQVGQIREPFTLICGYGDSGSKLVSAARRRLLRVTVIEIRQDRIDALMLDDSDVFVPGLCGDASIPGNLMLAGINHPQCQYVVALTNDNEANLHIAITAKVMNPGVQVICRADAHDIEANMASFGTDYIIDPFDSFARDLGLATYAPYQFLLSLWLRSEPGDELTEVQIVPEGRWIVCGYGRFGRAIVDEMLSHGLSVQVIEPDISRKNLPADTIFGDGTGEEILTAAGVADAVGIIAGTDDDSNNLSIIVTALGLNPGLFVIVRQNEQANQALFRASPASVAMEPSAVIARKIRTILTNRTIDEFLSLARARDDRWARSLTNRIRDLGQQTMPETWEVIINGDDAAAVTGAIRNGKQMMIGHLLQDYTQREDTLPVIALFHANDSGAFCLPPIHTLLSEGDKLLFIGEGLAYWKMKWTLANDSALEYVLTGENQPQTWAGKLLWRK